MDSSIYKDLFNSLDDQIAIIDAQGDVVAYNQSWYQGEGRSDSIRCGVSNYLDTCKTYADKGNSFSIAAIEGLTELIKGQKTAFSLDYPWKSEEKIHWFSLYATPLKSSKNLFIIRHQDITERKLIEEQNRLLAQTDSMTGLYNRRAFDELYLKEWRRALRAERPISIMMIDLDFFKSINDNYGHHAGDECLCRIADILTKTLGRPGDICCRYGGEEFIIALNNANISTGYTLAKRIKQYVYELNIDNIHSHHNQRLTVSIGIACVTPKNDGDPNALVHEADKALYIAKSNGRNTIACSSLKVSPISRTMDANAASL